MRRDFPSAFYKLYKSMTKIELSLRKSAYNRTYYLRHREDCINRAKAYYAAHKEERRLYAHAYNKL